MITLGEGTILVAILALVVSFLMLRSQQKTMHNSNIEKIEQYASDRQEVKTKLENVCAILPPLSREVGDLGQRVSRVEATFGIPHRPSGEKR